MISTLPKYEEIKQYICQCIYDKKMVSGDKLPTEKEICEMFDVSRITAKRALQDLQNNNIIYRVQGGGTFVGDMQTAKNADGTNLIPLIMFDLNETYRFSDVARGVESYLSPHNYHITLSVTSKENDLLNNSAVLKSKCAIIMPPMSNVDNTCYFNLQQQGIKLIFIDMVPNGVNTNMVTSDNIYGGYLATKHLIDQGFKKIATTSLPPISANTISDRILGYQLAHKEAGLSYNPEYHYFFQIGVSLEKYLDNILMHPDKFDAIFAINDAVAIELYNLCVRKGVRVPEDLAIMGYDNTWGSANLPVPLSTIDQDFYRLGYEAAKIAYSSSSEDNSSYKHTIIPVNLIVRESTQKK